MKKGQRVTIKDVAKMAKVTPQTVSRAFRNTHDISEKTRERILKIASQMGYVKNSSATSLRCGASKQVAVVYDNLRNCYFSIMTDFLQRCLKDCNYTTLAISVQDTHFTEEAYLSAVAHNVDGIISFLEPSEEIAELVKNYNVPVLLFGRRTDVENVDFIQMDNVTAGTLAAERFLSAHCKNPLLITEALEITCAYDRYCGFLEPFQKVGIQPKLHVNPLGDYLRVEPALLALYQEGTFPDAIFCFNDMIAFEVLYVVEKNHLPTPKVIGVDDIQQEIYFPKRLTTVGSNKKLMASKAVAMLIARMQGKRSVVSSNNEQVFLVEGETA